MSIGGMGGFVPQRPAVRAESSGLSQSAKVTADQAKVLAAMGFNNVSLVAVVSSQDEIARIRRRLKQINDSMIDKKAMEHLLKTLGLPREIDSEFFSDEEGGLYLLQEGLKELKNAY